MKKLILTCVILLGLINISSIYSNNLPLRNNNTIKIDHSVLNLPVSKANDPFCDEYKNYYGTSDIYWAWKFPNSYGDDQYSMRFTVDSEDFYYPASAAILLYSTFMSGTPNLKVYLWDDNESGLPCNKLDSAIIYFADLPTEPLAYVFPEFQNSRRVFFQGESFHISVAVDGIDGDTLSIVSDNADGIHTGERRSSFYVDDTWWNFEDSWGADYIFFMDVNQCNSIENPNPHTIHVPSEYETLQEAIFASFENDTVEVSDGIFTGDGFRDLTILWPIVIKSANGAEYTTINIDSEVGLENYENWHNAINYIAAFNSGIEIDGFTFINGHTERGGALRIIGGAPVIKNCIFKNNSVGTLYMPTMVRFGGGIYSSHSSMIVENCLFVNNTAALGAGIFIEGDGYPIINKCTFFGNDGTAINVSGTSYGNKARLDPTMVTISNCIISYSTHKAIFVNELAGYYSADVDLQCTNIYGNQNGDYVGYIESLLNDMGNINLNPLFCDTANFDFSIDSLSPCAPNSVQNSCGVLIGLYSPSCQQCIDADNDLICNENDNCPNVANVDQIDSDNDGIGDVCDNCPNDPENDIDGDGFCADIDNCITTYNPSQSDIDSDNVGDVCDNCVDTYNPNQTDQDDDGIGDECDSCTDTDNDGWGDSGFTNNTCPDDNCPLLANPSQTDTDNDGIGDECDPCTDSDADGFYDADFPSPFCERDNCPELYNPDQLDADLDGIGDICDNCINTPNVSQDDTDGDSFGDVCDNCPIVVNVLQEDIDFDLVGDSCDNCVDTYNPSQSDFDNDGVGDACSSSDCCEIRGDFNGSGDFTISDLTNLVNYMFNSGDGPVCFAEGDVTADEQITIQDLTCMVDYLFGDAPECVIPCP